MRSTNAFFPDAGRRGLLTLLLRTDGEASRDESSLGYSSAVRALYISDLSLSGRDDQNPSFSLDTWMIRRGYRSTYRSIFTPSNLGPSLFRVALRATRRDAPRRADTS